MFEWEFARVGDKQPFESSLLFWHTGDSAIPAADQRANPQEAKMQPHKNGLRAHRSSPSFLQAEQSCSEEPPGLQSQMRVNISWPTSQSRATLRCQRVLALLYWSLWQGTFFSPLPRFAVSQSPAHPVYEPICLAIPSAGLHKCLMESLSEEINFL